jgi:hypothetical protein
MRAKVNRVPLRRMLMSATTLATVLLAAGARWKWA